MQLLAFEKMDPREINNAPGHWSLLTCANMMMLQGTEDEAQYSLGDISFDILKHWTQPVAISFAGGKSKAISWTNNEKC